MNIVLAVCLMQCFLWVGTAIKFPTFKVVGWSRSKNTVRVSKIDDIINSPMVKTTNSSKGKKKVLILMSDTGGGHRASANALEKAMQVKYPGQLKVEIVDLWTEHGLWPFSKFVPGYRYLCKHPQLWRSFYNFGSFTPCKLFVETISRIGCYSRFHTAIKKHDPDLVVSVHPFCQDIPISIVADLNRHRAPGRAKIPFVTVVTDLGSAHSCWFDRRVDCCYVPSDCLFHAALKRGLNSNQVKQLGLPVRTAFWTHPTEVDRADLRRSLSLHPSLLTVLLMGGGDGVGGLAPIVTETVNHLNREKLPAQLVVVCGHNHKVLSKLKATLPSYTTITAPTSGTGTGTDADAAAAAECQGPCRVHLLSFVEEVDRYMTASDLLVSKAGPGTIAEAMTRGLPMVLSSYLPGQEAGNVPFVVNSGFGIYTGNRPKQIARTVQKLLSNDTLRQEMSRRALQCAQPHSTLDIAQDIGALLIG